MKKYWKLITGLTLIMVGAGVVWAATTSTQVGRLGLDHPDLGHEGGSALHTKVRNQWTLIADHMNSRYFTGSTVADSTTTPYVHGFGVAFAEYRIIIYTGTYPALTRVADFVAAGWTVVATSGSEKTSIDVTTPGSGGPHDYAVIVIHGRGAEKLDDLDDVDLTTSPEDGQALVWDGLSSQFIPGASGDSSFKCQSVSDPNLVIKSGEIIINEGEEFQISSDLTVNLDVVFGNPVNDTTYYLYIDMDAVPAAAVFNDRLVRSVTLDSDFFLSVDDPKTLGRRFKYIPVCVIHSADTGTVWSGTGATFFTLAVRRHDVSPLALNLTAFSVSDTVTNHGGTTGTITHNESIPVANQKWIARVNDGSTNTYINAGDFVTDLTSDVMTYDVTGLAGSDVVEFVLQDWGFSAQVVSTEVYNSGELSSAPATTFNHNLPGRPLEVVVWVEAANTAGAWASRDDICDATSTQLICDYGPLGVIDGTHKIQIIAAMTPGETAVREASATRSGLVNTGAQTLAGEKTWTGKQILLDDLSVTGTISGTLAVDIVDSDNYTDGSIDSEHMSTSALSSGTWTPVEDVSERTNINATSPGLSQFIRIGNRVHGVMRLGLNLSANDTATLVEFSLPPGLSSNFTSSTDAGGTCTILDTTVNTPFSGFLQASTGTDNFQIRFRATGMSLAVNKSWNCTFMYTIKP